MFCLTTKTITLGNSKYAMEKFEVWWSTPFGLFPDLNEAIKKCQELDMDPELMLAAVPVAIHSCGVYEVLKRG
jgi:hypothetical protein